MFCVDFIISAEIFWIKSVTYRLPDCFMRD